MIIHTAVVLQTERLIYLLTTDDITLTGMRFFSITRNFMLAVRMIREFFKHFSAQYGSFDKENNITNIINCDILLRNVTILTDKNTNMFYYIVLNLVICINSLKNKRNLINIFHIVAFYDQYLYNICDNHLVQIHV